MKKLLSSFFLFLILPFIFIHPAHAGEPSLFKVLKVVDGDTLVVDVRGKRETIRLLGIDTPETVDPRRPVQCFGKVASDKMKALVLGKAIILVDDNTQGNRDKYHRLLRYVYLPDSKRTFINGEMIKQGYAFSYRQYPTKMLNKFNNLEKYAREHNFGLWGSCPINPKAVSIPTKAAIKQLVPIKSGTNLSTGGDKDCADFATHADAQAFFITQGGPDRDPHKLDGNHDGTACETLP